jgi:mannose/cellobiose epimerase-like protein (N-acyl-D-glucosamine 2-epimerase family)
VQERHSLPTLAGGIDFGQVRAWVFQGALPLWAERGFDAGTGGFVEELSFEGRPTECEFVRVRVLCRQVQVFAHAALLGWSPGAEISARGCDYLFAHARLADGGWARRLSRAGAVIDPAPDLYDLSCVLFALAWRFRLSGEREARDGAEQTLDFIQRHFRAPAGGFWPSLPAGDRLLQNPLMHFAEACIAGFEATRDQRYLDQAGELALLFRTRLFDGTSLGEAFDARWRRLPSEAGLGPEPGHHFEWAWLLARYQFLAGVALADEATALCDYAERHGVDASSRAVFDELGDDGAPRRTSSRAWPNSERIKAHLALFELTGRDPRVELAGSLGLLFERYFADMPAGMWRDQFDTSGACLARAVPASSFYHLFSAFAEVLRLEPRLVAAYPERG